MNEPFFIVMRKLFHIETLINISIVAFFLIYIKWLTVKKENFKPNHRLSGTQSDGVNKQYFQNDRGKEPFRIFNFCNNSIQYVKRLFVLLQNAMIDPDKASGKRGGEPLADVMNQQETNEHLNLSFGYFKVQCPASAVGDVGNHEVKLMDFVKFLNRESNVLPVHRGLTFVIRRMEYANLYHCMTDWYNVFLATRSIDPESIKKLSVIFLDSHPMSSLDTVWPTLFGKVIRAGNLRNSEKFSNLILMASGHDSFLNQHKRLNLPYIESFKSFFLEKHGFHSEPKINCLNLNIMFIWRRDYVAHPRNPSGVIQRKIANEKRLEEVTRQVLKNDNVIGLQLDNFTIKQQLRHISKTNILIGMHGAGLSLSLFLPRRAAVLELFPKYVNTGNIHFRSFARWRKLHYLSWRNIRRDREFDNYYTEVDVDVVLQYVIRLRKRLCSNKY